MISANGGLPAHRYTPQVTPRWPWGPNRLQWTHEEQARFQELKKKISSTNCLGVPRPKGDIIPIIDACDARRGL